MPGDSRLKPSTQRAFGSRKKRAWNKKAPATSAPSAAELESRPDPLDLPGTSTDDTVGPSSTSETLRVDAAYYSTAEQAQRVERSAQTKTVLSGKSATQRKFDLLGRSHTPGKRPLSETAEARLGRPSARPEGAPVGKRSYWYVPKALKDYKPDEKPRETRRYKYRTPDPSSVDDSPIGTVKQPTYNFWQNSGRSWKRSTRPGPELLMESDGVEAAVNSLKAAAAKGSETSSPKAQSPRVCKLLERRGEEPPMPPKGVKRKAKDAFAQTEELGF
ncbi:hypothetical protein HPB52_002824 [Rhipicephalus sanguineus]|uniref:Uncharacterized protein n=1 Tax=Rhipicephalus sanguineus TaxID=34632 RepID=A0A9D4Q9K4_RHISA|nr:hypothetical protein HPB52_002824 [Rhipicephalus sanguineus]